MTTVFGIGRRNVKTYLAGYFLFIAIGGRCPVIDTPEARRRPGNIEHRGDQGRLPRVAVTYNAQVSDLLCLVCLHRLFLLRERMCSVEVSKGWCSGPWCV